MIFLLMLVTLSLEQLASLGPPSPKTSWFGPKPFMFFSEFYDATAHNKASLRSQPAFFIVLVTV